jgi:hypothetical protein
MSDGTDWVSGTIYPVRNRIINGAMVIDQRNSSASITPTNSSYGLDRWGFGITQASKFTAQQNAGSVTTPAGFTNYLGITSSSAYSITSGDIFYVRQPIEGYNVADLDFGTANAQTVTLSFWVRSSLTGTFGGALQNAAENRSYPFSYTISAANTWEKETITITGDTSGTWLTSTGIGLNVVFGLGVGSTYSGTANSWQASQKFAPTGATSVVGTNGATWYVTGVQLEQGSTATPFERRLYSQELLNCQRYYQIARIGNCTTAPSTQTTEMYGQANFFVPMRTTPTFAQNGIFTFDLPYVASIAQSASSPVDWTGLNANGGGNIVLKNFSGLTFNRVYIPTSGTTNSMLLSAEL